MVSVGDHWPGMGTTRSRSSGRCKRKRRGATTLHMSVCTYISKLTVVSWRAGSAAFGLVTAQSPGVLALACSVLLLQES